MACEGCKNLYERCQELEAQRDALLEALRVGHDHGGHLALLRVVAETLREQADRDESFGYTIVARSLRKLADQLAEKHNADCAAIAKVEDKR